MRFSYRTGKGYLIQPTLKSISLSNKSVNDIITSIGIGNAMGGILRVEVRQQNIPFSSKKVSPVYLGEYIQDSGKGPVTNLPIPRETAG